MSKRWRGALDGFDQASDHRPRQRRPPDHDQNDHGHDVSPEGLVILQMLLTEEPATTTTMNTTQTEEPTIKRTENTTTTEEPAINATFKNTTTAEEPTIKTTKNNNTTEEPAIKTTTTTHELHRARASRAHECEDELWALLE